MATLQSLAEMRRQLLAPAAAALPGLAEQAGALSAALAGWVTRFEGRTDQVSREYRKATQSSVPRPACPPATPCLTSMCCWAAPFAELPGRPSGRSGGVASGHPGVAACRAPHLPAAAAARVVPCRTGGGWGRGKAVGYMGRLIGTLGQKLGAVLHCRAGVRAPTAQPAAAGPGRARVS